MNRFASALFAVALGSLGCGTSSGNQAASLAGDVVGRALSGSGKAEKPAAWSTDEAHCKVFRDHQMACPALRTCKALFGTTESGLTINVCVTEFGDIAPIKGCHGGTWCRASAFPPCESLPQAPCSDFDKVICEEASGRRRVAQSRIDPASVHCSYEIGRLFGE